jgi:6-phosphofructokinase 1
MVKRLAVLTSGGDCSGMNAAIRAVVRVALAEGIEVLGIRKGYRGLLDRDFESLTARAISSILQRGGTFLQSARCLEMLEEAGQKKAAEILKGLGVEGLVIIGGDGSLRGALALHQKGINVIGIPASIDNDIPFTDICLGVDTALNNIIYAVDCLKDTASSHDRAFVVEVMGRNCGYLALTAAITCGAEHALIPEVKYDLDAICKNLRKRYLEGRSNSIIMVAEGVATAKEIADKIKDCEGFETRLMVLGHYQRGGSPSHFDRLLGSSFGQAAVEALLKGTSGKMVGLVKSRHQFTDLKKILVSGMCPIDPDMLKLAAKLVN